MRDLCGGSDSEEERADVGVLGEFNEQVVHRRVRVRRHQDAATTHGAHAAQNSEQ